MPGILRTPTDQSAPPLVGAPMAPPIIPNRTVMNPGAMREVLRREQGLSDDGETDEQPQSEQSLLIGIGNLFWQAGEYPGLQDVMVSLITALKQAADQQHAMIAPPPSLRMPVPTMAPEVTAPREDMLGGLLAA